MMRRLLILSALAGALLASAVALLAFPVNSARGAVTLPPSFSQSQVVSGLMAPTDMEFAPDGRLFVAEQAGKVLIAEPDGTLATFLDISSEVDSTSERGLLGVTFDPDFSTNHFVYLYYTREATDTTPAHNRVARVTASGDSAVPGSEVLIFQLNDQSTSPIHQGGAIDFGKDGKLYVSTGDNGTPADAQKLTNLFGKMVRINKDGTIPSRNPFYARASGNNRAIWALGLRNPFKFAVKPGAGTIFINDVGEDTWEEINRGAARANYGWPAYEGPESDPRYAPPVYAYGHGGTNTTGCSITGGAFYKPATVQFPSDYVGDYFFAEFCNGWIGRYNPATGVANEFAAGLSSVVDLEVSKDGELYHLSRSRPGSVGKISYTGN